MRAHARGWVSAASAVVLLAWSASVGAELPPGLDKMAVARAFDAAPIGTCKLAKGPRGEGHVVITLLGSGKVKSAVIDTPSFARTKVGECVTKAFRRVRVQPFKGDPVVLGKKFRIE